MARIYILPIRYNDAAILGKVSEAVQEEFQRPVMFANHAIDIQFAYDERRDQYHSSKILLALQQIPHDGHDKVIAITSHDLFIPILTFVFGEAQLDGPAAVVSSHRLRPEYYGLPPDPALLQQRLIKETIHELGHTFGLHHCHNIGCVLNASTYVEEIELKSQHFCWECRGMLQSVI